MIACIEPRSTCPDLIGKIPGRSAPQIPALSEGVAQHARRPLAPFLGLAPTCPEETRGISHSPSLLLLPTDHCPLIIEARHQSWSGDPDRLGTAHHSFKSFRCNTYAPPRKCCEQKTYAPTKSQLSIVDATLTKNRGEGSRLWLTRNPKRDSCHEVYPESSDLWMLAY